MNVDIFDFVDIIQVEDKKLGNLFILSVSPSGDVDTVLNLAFPPKEFVELCKTLVKRQKEKWIED